MRWGILGAASFAQGFMAPAINAARGSRLVALATSDPAKAAPFEAIAPGLRVFADYDALLADPDIDAIYIPLPNHLHVEWTIKALKAGKHVLCEKPIALKEAEFGALIAARDASGKLAAEGFMIVHHPQFVRAKQLLAEGAIGKLRHVDAAFSFNNAGQTDNIRNRPETGGGALRDIGVYTFGSARFVTGEEPVSVPFANIQLENNVDVYVQTAAEFPSFSYGAMVSMRLFNRQSVTFHGDKGVMTLTCPYNANVFDLSELTLENNGLTRIHERWPATDQYVHQVENFVNAAENRAEYLCPLEFSRGTQRMMDMVFAAGGL